MRNENLGILLGYVKIPEHHPLYEAVEEQFSKLDVHGGITFNGYMKKYDGYFLGFDCCHAGDLAPAIVEQAGITHEGDTYKNILFVENELNHLAEQISNLGLSNEQK